MKRYLLFFCVAIAAMSACKKSDKFDAAAQAKLDDAQIVKYLADSSITATKDESGLYYQIITPGAAVKPTTSNGIFITYEGKLMTNGTVFDSKTTPYYFPSMDGLIQGWQIGVPKIGKGGRIKLFIPSGLAYKNNDTGSIPANSVLIFDITLVNFN
ncbi:FKBP-type peptidyl-prolyl cis-trans isomerase [Mucilaginibacter auburnensis]|uniref:Peptidyl-prolyl cis-trans isomerase n=1 Tax=Mucilaginibacter auburnensis TaxID=1457233 RepID=A0A2H9VQA7_9SPHI|nr:FKBP-type peptidyl-prolyl cis-trans isomerase [Mucilaginibacter auburnensis]PJJ80470.1 FKBP-type peptidyl-prolyl cis-trans isomerase FkpA [Mucilaginibacter auburnensis]